MGFGGSAAPVDILTCLSNSTHERSVTIADDEDDDDEDDVDESEDWDPCVDRSNGL
jgi:hypothetical protein